MGFRAEQPGIARCCMQQSVKIDELNGVIVEQSHPCNPRSGKRLCHDRSDAASSNNADPQAR
jgi:hypothetical protein